PCCRRRSVWLSRNPWEDRPFAAVVATHFRRRRHGGAHRAVATAASRDQTRRPPARDILSLGHSCQDWPIGTPARAARRPGPPPDSQWQLPRNKTCVAREG